MNTPTMDKAVPTMDKAAPTMDKAAPEYVPKPVYVPKYVTHTHSKTKTEKGGCRFCAIEEAWAGDMQSIVPVQDRRTRVCILCVNKHSCVLSDADAMKGCPICRLADSTIHSGIGYISRADNMTRHTCYVCDSVYFAKYGAEKLACSAGHSILSDAESVRVNVIAALELVIGQTADDWFLHCYTDFHACSMSYKIIAFVGTPEEYTETLLNWDIEVQSTECSMEKIIDARTPRNRPYLWLSVRIDPSYAHDFEKCVEQFIAGTDLHDWLRNNRRKDIPERLAAYKRTGRKFSVFTERSKFPTPRLMSVYQPR